MVRTGLRGLSSSFLLYSCSVLFLLRFRNGRTLSGLSFWDVVWVFAGRDARRGSGDDGWVMILSSCPPRQPSSCFPCHPVGVASVVTRCEMSPSDEGSRCDVTGGSELYWIDAVGRYGHCSSLNGHGVSLFGFLVFFTRSRSFSSSPLPDSSSLHHSQCHLRNDMLTPDYSRHATYARTPAKSPSCALSQAAKSASPAPTNLRAIPASTITITRPHMRVVPLPERRARPLPRATTPTTTTTTAIIIITRIASGMMRWRGRAMLRLEGGGS